MRARRTDMLQTLARCSKARSATIHGLCKTIYRQRLP
jgi:hypothetical protein